MGVLRRSAWITWLGLWALAALGSGPAAAQTPQVPLDTAFLPAVSAQPGDSVVVPLYVGQDPMSFVGAEFSIVFAGSRPSGLPALTLPADGVSAGSLFPPDVQMAANTSTSGRVDVSVLAQDLTNGPGTLALLRFQVPPSAPPGGVYQLAITQLILSDEHGTDVSPSNIVSGQITVGMGSSSGSTPVMGDLNGDGKVSVADATIALRIVVGLATATPAQLAAGDFAGNGRITIADVLHILRLALGLA